MNKIIKNTIYVQIQKLNFYYTVAYGVSQRINQIFEILRLYCFAFTALAIDKTFTQRNFLPARLKLRQRIFQ